MLKVVRDAIFGLPHADASAMLAALWQGLADSGVPVARSTVALRTLHPHIVGLGYVWEVGQGVTENQHSHGELSLPRFLNSPLREIFEGRGPLRFRLAGDAPLPFPSLAELRAKGLTEYLAFPLVFTDGELHAMTVATATPTGFTDAEVELFADIAPLVAVALEARETRRVARTLLDTYVGVRAGGKVLAGHIRRGDVEIIDAVLLSCDLRGFTALSADVTPEAVVAALSTYFERVCGPIDIAGGEILKFIGDGILAAFPVESPALVGRTCQAALAATREGFASLEAATALDLPPHHLPLRAGAALHVGQVAFGNIGSPSRLDFTVIGPAVNLASRLAGLCARLGRPLLASRAFADQVPEGAIALGAHALRGLASPVDVFAY